MLVLDKSSQNVWKIAFLLPLSSSPRSAAHSRLPKVTPLTAFPCGPFLACRGRLCKWCSHAAFRDFYSSTWALLLSAVIHPVYGHFYYQYISPSMHHFSQLLSLSFWVVFHRAALFTFHNPGKRESELVRKSVRERLLYYERLFLYI